MKNKLILSSISSVEVDIYTWQPENDEDVFICLDLEIEYSDGVEGSNLFYVTMATPEALKKYRKGPILVKNRTIVLSEFSYDIAKSTIIEILEYCTRDSWEESCSALQRYFLWEYEDYSVE